MVVQGAHLFPAMGEGEVVLIFCHLLIYLYINTVLTVSHPSGANRVTIILVQNFVGNQIADLFNGLYDTVSG